MDYSVCSINYDDRDLRANEFLFQSDIPYNYGTFVVKSTSADYSEMMYTYLNDEYDDALLDGILKEYAGAWKKLAGI